jgi:hypothetical protein
LVVIGQHRLTEFCAAANKALAETAVGMQTVMLTGAIQESKQQLS